MITIDVEKGFNKIQPSFIIVILRSLSGKTTTLNLIKHVYDRHIANIRPASKFLLMSGKIHWLGDLVDCIQKLFN